MLEYSAVLVGGMQEAWAAQILLFFDMIRSSPYFWPGVAVAALTFLLVTRQFLR